MSQEHGTAIRFPSPSALLRPDQPSANGSPNDNVFPVRNQSRTAQSTSKTKSEPSSGKAKTAKVQADAPEKPKQSKSRNGCVTCKLKRLKCDETKPTCRQCQKRQVECGGYKKDFKWRPFAETSFVQKPAGPGKPKRPDLAAPASTEQSSPKRRTPAPTPSEASDSTAASKNNSQSPPSQNVTPALSRALTAKVAAPWAVDSESGDAFTLSRASNYVNSNKLSKAKGADLKLPGSIAESPSSGSYSTSVHDSNTDYDDLAMSQIEETRSVSWDDTLRTGSCQDDAGIDEVIEMEDNRIDEQEGWALVTASNTADGLVDATEFDFTFLDMLLHQPQFNDGGASALLDTFNRDTCGILSVRDGPTENPWRTAILPLVPESAALGNAVAAVAAFHASKIFPGLKNPGVEYVRRSVQFLARDLQRMPPDVGLATTLVLAFAESWDIHVSTGIQHLRGAKQFIQLALPEAKRRGPNDEFSRRIRFLCNVWVYMDVIARLTSPDADDSTYFDTVLNPPNFSSSGGDGSVEIDPLMGCASSLFPLIGRVANLVRRVCRSTSTPLPLITQAQELKDAIENWSPPLYLHKPEDISCDVEDSVRTAEAYRWATLLYLHQAVPEVPSLPTAQLAKNALVQLALVPLASRTTIVHIYPLLAAGCEASMAEDRQWITERWEAMSQRMLIGNIDRCLEVVREVWARRDADPAAFSSAWGLSNFDRPDLGGMPVGQSPTPNGVPQQSNISWNDTKSVESKSAFDATRSNQVNNWQAPLHTGTESFPIRLNTPPVYKTTPTQTDDVPMERSVRGQQHWVGVMRDWNWEVLLG